MSSIFLKALGYRTLATLVTIVAGALVTGSLSVGVAIGGVEFALKLLGYMAYEYLWSAGTSERVKPYNDG